MGVEKTTREVRKIVEPLGYELEGLNGNGHLVFVHPETGAVWRQSTKEGRSPGTMRGQALRNIKNARGASHLFVQYVLKRAEVGPHDTKTVKLQMGPITRQFVLENPDLKVEGPTHGADDASPAGEADQGRFAWRTAR
jgi:hypothetical protein